MRKALISLELASTLLAGCDRKPEFPISEETRKQTQAKAIAEDRENTSGLEAQYIADSNTVSNMFNAAIADNYFSATEQTNLLAQLRTTKKSWENLREYKVQSLEKRGNLGQEQETGDLEIINMFWKVQNEI